MQGRTVHPGRSRHGCPSVTANLDVYGGSAITEKVEPLRYLNRRTEGWSLWGCYYVWLSVLRLKSKLAVVVLQYP